ncbi:cyclic-di-AMP-binding protein CbpB [Texcoconibacillus texcoconensis]|uniref:Putative transcriptional regulator n=1 Tax=Texcoconibacillus texcoconensis TaxID=1095777 RepID=A0A840QNR4_9BACI|nr:cyclic-di-AMP-binding protein CbpB [Texcoconibacillus texcoconensis]MBB5173014.1 putative transcriptional regulator [Texcoconibacillus texcoconensis]
MQNVTEPNVLQKSIESFMIPMEKVAHVQPDNALEHALLVLVKSGYTSIPVLDTSSKLQGLISKSEILDATLGIERIDPEQLADKKVKDVMTTNIASMNIKQPLERALSLSIQNPFICVEDDEHSFLGIITRSKLLAFISGYLHENKNNQRDES